MILFNKWIKYHGFIKSNKRLVMQKYELMLIIWSVNNTEKSAKEIISLIKNEIEKNWWEITFNDFWWSRKLAYKIKNNTNWYYNVFNFNINWDSISNLKSFINLDNNIIRYIIFKIDNDYKPLTKSDLTLLEQERYKELQEKKSYKKWSWTWTLDDFNDELSWSNSKKSNNDIDSKISSLMTDL